MYLDRTTKHRLGLAAVLVAGLVATIFSLRVVVKLKKNSDDVRTLHRGYDAFEDGEYQAAIDLISSVRYQFSEDPRLMRTLAQANERVRPRRDFHLVQAMNAYDLYVGMAPWDTESRAALMELDVKLGRWARAIQTADALLASPPGSDDARARRAKALAMLQSGRLDAGRVLIEAYAAEAPGDFVFQAVLQEALLDDGRPPTQLIADARAMVSADAENATAWYLLGVAAMASRDVSGAASAFARAADLLPDDEQALIALCERLDALGRPNKATWLVDRGEAAGGAEEAAVWTMYRLHRWFELGDAESIVIVGGVLDLASVNQSTRLLGIVGWAADRVGQTSLRATALETLRARAESDQEAAGWVALLSGDQETIAAAQSAVEALPDHYLFRGTLGVALAEIGEAQQAIPHLEAATNDAQVWPAAWVALTRSLLESGRVDEAIVSARAARQRSDSLDARLLAIATTELDLSALDPSAPAQLLRDIEVVQSLVPGEPASLLTKMRVLARLGRPEAAAAVAQSLIEEGSRAGYSHLVDVAEASDVFGLGVGDAARAAAEARFGSEPGLIFRRAEALAASGRVGEARAAVDAMPRGDAAAALTRAAFIERWQPEEAGAAYGEMIDAFASHPGVLQSIATAPRVRAERPLHRRAIDALRAQTSESAATWRIEQARYLLSNPDGASDIELSRAEALLDPVIRTAPTLADARYLSAEVFMLRGLPVEAARQLKELREARPDLVNVALRLVEVLQSVDNHAQAKQVLDELVDEFELGRAALMQVARLYARQGDLDDAVGLLEDLRAEGELRQTNDLLLLAELYQQSGRTTTAGRLVEQMLADPTPEAYGFAARFYGSTGESARADEMLEAMGGLSMGVGQRERMRAAYFAERGRVEEAVASFRAVVEAQPADAQAWGTLLRYLVAVGRVEDALAVAGEADAVLGAGPGGAVFGPLLAEADAVRRLADEPRALGLIAALTDPEQALVAGEALRALAADDLDLDRVARLANEHQSALSLQTLYARMLLSDGQAAAAGRVAASAMRRHPNVADIAALAAEAYSEARMWTEAVDAAAAYRRRSPGRALRADLVLAEALINVGQYDRAAATLASYLDAAPADERVARRLHELYVTAMVRNGRSDDAAVFLRSRLASSPDWRAFWWAQLAAVEPSTTRCVALLRAGLADVPADDADERLTWAAACWAAYRRLRAEALLPLASGELHALTRTGVAGSAWQLIALIEEERGDLDAAASAYIQTLESGERPGSLNNLALIRMKQDRLEEAVALAERATTLEPGAAAYWDTLGQVFSAAGRTDEAVEALGRAIGLNPERETYRERLGGVLQEAGRSAELVEMLRDFERPQ